MPNFAVYDSVTGRILRVGTGPIDAVPLQALVGESSIVTSTLVSDLTHHFDGSEVAALIPLGASLDVDSIASDGVAVATLAPLPDPVTLTIDGAETVITGGSLELTVSNPGDYKIVIDLPDRLTETWSVEGV